jgi:hypothetical protein
MASSHGQSSGNQSEPEMPANASDMVTDTNSSSLVKQESKAAPDGVPTPQDWKELALLIEREKDPARLVELVQRLISRFDEENQLKVLQKGADTK